MFRRSALAVPLLLLTPASILAQQPTAEKGSKIMTEVTARSLQWTAAEIPGFVSGMQLAVVNGDPGKAGPYTMRLRFPDGYAFPAHFHPQDEHLTVLSGTFLLGMGGKTNVAELKQYGPGDYLFMPASMPHFGQVKGETVIQLHGTGPFDITVVEKIAGASQ